MGSLGPIPVSRVPVHPSCGPAGLLGALLSSAVKSGWTDVHHLAASPGSQGLGLPTPSPACCGCWGGRCPARPPRCLCSPCSGTFPLWPRPRRIIDRLLWAPQARLLAAGKGHSQPGGDSRSPVEVALGAGRALQVTKPPPPFLSLGMEWPHLPVLGARNLGGRRTRHLSAAGSGTPLPGNTLPPAGASQASPARVPRNQRDPGSAPLPCP